MTQANLTYKSEKSSYETKTITISNNHTEYNVDVPNTVTSAIGTDSKAYGLTNKKVCSGIILRVCSIERGTKSEEMDVKESNGYFSIIHNLQYSICHYSNDGLC